MLEKILQRQFRSSDSPRGIIFTRTRQSAHSLLLWLQQQPGLQTVDIRAQLLIGAGNSSQSTHMTQRDQQEVIRKFRDGTLNLLVATSVAEEGLDIPQCNVVVRYGLLTNEISMVQARGRARADQSVYSFVATEGSRELKRELINEALEMLMEQAVAAVQKMDQAEYQAKIQDLQQAALTKRAAQAAQRESQSTHMTQRDQQEVIRKFRDGTLNLLVATSVAEEGLDIPQCNVVVRYGLLTNEISMVQARGRARADQSVYSFVATEGSRESQRRQFPVEHVQLLCINCMVAVGHGSDLRKVEGTHHVNVNPNFSIYYNVSRDPVVINKVFKDWKPGGVISCRNCGEIWGLQMIYKSVKLPALKVRSMLLETPQGRIQAKKWSRVPFSVPDFDFLQHCAQNLSDLSLD
uniref:Macaca fascicularis brain cDNA clone: QtrA-16087, similar to human likely ortholog of mouse D11lgp2 (LGP2), mRNA, RefSeq: NM_024119.1 n=1 Tax=Macaca fascicularis TaxID=9541 RepID=I7G9B9_MACFA|nr:unnamed protein product [Macaca fascicularis]